MARTIMIQGTASDAGKSIIVTGLCRIFAEDGYRVAPFKAQNMSSNSFVMPGNKEIAKSVAIQAYAAKTKPSVLMNPVLMKPTNDTGAEIIVKGEKLGMMNAKEYHVNKSILKQKVKDCFDQLAKDKDIIVIEGAGSPAEINLKKNDIVNMGMAKMVNAPVILVGDIDRGGVFAALAGTMLLLDEEEKALVKGIIINKFRGEIELLTPGVKQIEEIIMRKSLGVVPYLNVDIEKEDSLSANDIGVYNEEYTKEYMESNLKKLAKELRKYLNMEEIYKIVKEGESYV